MPDKILTVEELDAYLKENGTVPGGYRFNPHAKVRWTTLDGTPVESAPVSEPVDEEVTAVDEEATASEPVDEEVTPVDEEAAAEDDEES